MPVTAANPTLLVIAPVSGGTAFVVSPYGARGLTQTLQPENADSGDLVVRDINGTLMDLTYPQFEKYVSTISCTDQDKPTLNDGWIGEIVTVDCVKELSYAAGGSPARPVVSGSSRTDAVTGITYYRPQLTMMVTGWTSSFSEYAAEYSWQLNLREV